MSSTDKLESQIKLTRIQNTIAKIKIVKALEQRGHSTVSAVNLANQTIK